MQCVQLWPNVINMGHARSEDNVVVFFVNGKKVVDDQVDPEWTLLFYLRNKLRLCGTKLGCAEGGCGACTVMVSRYDRTNNKIIHLPVNACLAPVCSMHGLAVTTVEGIGSTKTKLHPVQERIAKAHGSQCGFCTPGMVMSMYTLLRNTPKPKMKQLEVAFQGNLCRCTGYRPIVEGFRTFTEEWETVQHNGLTNGGLTNGCAMGEKCCKLQNGFADDPDEALFNPSEFIPYDSSQEPIFPPELKVSDQYDRQYLVIKGENVTWYRPTELTELLELKKRFPESRLIIGNSEIRIENKFKHLIYPVVIQPVLILELVAITSHENGVRVGASATLVDIIDYLRNEIETLPEEKTRIFKTMVNMLNLFGGKQIRSVAALGSNIMTGSRKSDMLPLLMANEVLLELQSKDKGVRKVLLDKNFFIGYRKTVVLPEEILLAIHIPYTNPDRYCYAYKQARRREDDIAIVNATINVTFEPKTDIISDINLAFGGMSTTTVTAPKTRLKLKGLPWNQNTLELAFTTLQEDLPLAPGASGGMVLYKKSLTLSLFFKMFLKISVDLQKYIPHVKIDKRELSGIEDFYEKTFKSSQYYTVIPETQDKKDSFRRPIVHMSAYKQATGEAIYCDDIPFFENELFLAFVMSTKPHAKILSIDPSEALAMEGVEYFVSAKDIDKDRNFIGTIVKDENIFFNDKVTSQGQIIGGIVAIDQSTARKAVRKVKVEYEELQPVILTNKDAIKHNSFLGNPPRVIENGDIEKILREAPHVLEGECQTGGQEHFYLETQCCVAVPKQEDDEIDIYSSSQHPTEVATMLADALGIQQNQIVVKVKRLGGGFGGKESKSANVAVPVAIAAVKLKRPIRCMLDRDEDIVMTGGRHPFLIKYKVAFDDRGKILGLDIKLYMNCGYSVDLSPAILERAITHLDGAYNFSVIHAEGYLCKTNLPSNTAFRGFGAPQSMFGAETILQHISDYLNKDPAEIRQLNVYKDGDLTHYKQKLLNCNLDKCFEQCIQSSHYHERRKQVDKFNRENRFKKRGLGIVATKFGISFPSLHLNQGGALVLVYVDGSVLVSHGGIEMGQGLHTKVIQVASKTLEIPIEKIHIVETSTDKVPNTSQTAASSGSDLNGGAVLDACNIIKERLRPYKEADPKGTWEDWVKKAYLDRVSLSTTGFYKTPNIGQNNERFNYFTYGVACCEVEIDTLTGDHKVHKVDIVMDVGESLNPAIDIGQIEGGFTQGYGLFVLEELMYSPTGKNFTTSPSTYKLPGIDNIPGEFNVTLLKGASNPRAVYSSKGIGEPPFFLGSSAMFAIKDAIKAARTENGYKTNNFVLNPPATSAKIRVACEDNITAKFEEPEPGTFKPWNVVV